LSRGNLAGAGGLDCIPRALAPHFTGAWSAPALLALEGGNIGFQLGGQTTDFVLLVMNPKGAKSILSSEVKLGAGASAAAGPKRRDAVANTDIVMKAEVLNYSPIAGSIQEFLWKGRSLRSDGSANKKLLRARAKGKDIVRGGRVGMPASRRELIARLDKSSPKNHSHTKSLGLKN